MKNLGYKIPGWIALSVGFLDYALSSSTEYFAILGATLLLIGYLKK